jgi:hypothetical protein
MSIVNTVIPGTYVEVNGHGAVDCTASGCGFNSVSSTRLHLPMYVAAAYKKTVPEDSVLFGIVASPNNMFALRGSSSLNVAKCHLRDIPAYGLAYAQTPMGSSPINGLTVEDAAAVLGTFDVSPDGHAPTSNTHAWTADYVSPWPASYGINISQPGTVAYSKVVFFGGLILEHSISNADRVMVSAYLRSLINRSSESTDVNIIVIGDSTGDKVSDGTNTDGEWPWRFAVEKLAADHPNSYVGIRGYNEDYLSYTPEIVVQQGDGSTPSYRVYNCSVAGRMPQFVTGKQFSASVSNVPSPSVIIWNHGHNIADAGPLGSYSGRFLGAMEQVRLRWPGVPHMTILENPWRDGTQMEPLIAALRGVVALYGDIPAADVHQVYLDYSPPKSPALYADNVHPSIPVGVSVWLPSIFAMWDANYPAVGPVAPAFLATSGSNLLANGDFSSFSGAAPDAWSLNGNGSIVIDASMHDRALRSVKLTNGVSSTYIAQTVSAVAQRGTTVTLSVRQFIADGGDLYAGQISISSDGAGGSTVVNFGGDDARGSGGWRWTILQYAVPVDATTISVDLYASATGGVDKGTVYMDRVILVSGSAPRDMA